MQPRLKSSKKWSPLPKELLKQIQSVFSQGFKEHTQGAKISADGRIYPEEILFSVGFKASGSSLRQSNWEVSIQYVKNKDNVLKLLHTGVDVIGALFEQLFTAENDHDFPRIWEEVEFEDRKVFVQYSTVNQDLEAEADKLLGVKEGIDDAVAQGDWKEDLDPDVLKATLGIDLADLELNDEAGESISKSKPKPAENAPAATPKKPVAKRKTTIKH